MFLVETDHLKISMQDAPCVRHWKNSRDVSREYLAWADEEVSDGSQRLDFGSSKVEDYSGVL